MSDFDMLLYRPIRSGKEFENLMPKTTCKMELTGKGMTDLSIKEMAFMVSEYEWQTEEIAELLEKETLEATCKAIHDFTYNHFQYKADEELQLLRSPACSWFDRHNGIDCKSYSIIASCILTNLGIRHSIRKIKQSAFSPNDFTHVYVVVPKNQNTGNLSDGNYYTIDGTLPTMEEPSKIDKSDLDMLQHARLNGAHQGLNGGINMETVKGLFSSFACIGGDGFREGEYKWAQEAMIVHYAKLVDSVNASIVAKDFAQLSVDFNEIFGTGKATVQAYERKLSSGWNACSTKRLKGMIALSKFYRDNVGAAVTAYISKYFTASAAGTSLRYNASAMEGAPLNFRFIYTDPHVIIDEPVFNYQFSAGTTSIPKLEITQYVADNASNPASFNPTTFLQGLSQILVSFQPGSNPNTQNPNIITDPTTGMPINVTPVATSKMGAGTVVGLLLVTAGLAYAFTKTPDKPTRTASKITKK